MMKKLSELAALVAVRNHASLMTQSRNLTTNEEYKVLDELRRRLDKKFIEEVSKLVIDSEPIIAQALVRPEQTGRQPAVTVVAGQVVIEGDVRKDTPKEEPKQLELPIAEAKPKKTRKKSTKKTDSSLSKTQQEINKRVAEEKAKVQQGSFRRSE
jgi:hypothetical protein